MYNVSLIPNIMKVAALILLLQSIVYSANGAKILLVFPMPARSHYILGSALARELTERGHDVTMISQFGEKDPPKNGTYRDIILTGLYEELNKVRKTMNFYEREELNPFVNMLFISVMSNGWCEKTMAHPNVQKLIHSDEKFDVVIVEQFLNDAQKALATHFEAPLITFSTVATNSWINPTVGNPTNPAYIPELFMSYSSKMTFFERATNTLSMIFTYALHHLYIYPKQNAVIQRTIPNPPQLDDVLYNASLVLLNSHTSINQPVPFVPNMVEIAGFHVKPPGKLPKDLQDFLDNAKNGVVYFSMGSNLKSKDLPLAKREALLNTFSKLKEQVLWKWEDDVLPNQPANVKLGKWLPQQDILAHPNVKLFITHGGFLSTTETIYHGVPVLAIPILGDQKINAQHAVHNGFGLMLLFGELNEQTLTDKVNELLTNPKYRNNAKIKSEIFHDRQVTPMDRAVYSVEYVIRHKGAPHLRISGLDLRWHQFHLLDVAAFLLTIVSIVSYVNYLLLKKTFNFMCRKFCSKKKQTKLKKQ